MDVGFFVTKWLSVSYEIKRVIIELVLPYTVHPCLDHHNYDQSYTRK